MARREDKGKKESKELVTKENRKSEKKRGKKKEEKGWLFYSNREERNRLPLRRERGCHCKEKEMRKKEERKKRQK